MNAFTIRLYRPKDNAALIALFRDSVRQIGSDDYTETHVLAWAPDAIDAEKFAAKRISKPTWVAEIGERIAGFSDLESDGHIDMLYVHPDFQRRGVARALLAHIETTARTRGLDRLYTEASITACPVFKAQGFHVLAAQTVTVSGELFADTGVLFTNYRMEKQLVGGHDGIAGKETGSGESSAV